MTVAPPVLKVEVDFTGNPTAGHADILEGQDDVTSFWRMDSTSTFLDSVGTNPGVIEGTPTLTTSPLLYDADSALAFDGSSDAAYVPTSADLTSKANFTAAGWLYLPSPAGTRDTVAKRGAWLLQTNTTGNLIATLKDDTSTATVTSNTALAVSTWYHVALVYNSVTVSIYINGILDNSVAYTSGWEAGSQPIRFAAAPSTASPTFQSFQSAVASTATPTVTAPASIASGDLLTAQLCIEGSQTVTVVPTGWVLLAAVTGTVPATRQDRIYYKIATGSEPGSYQWTLSGAVAHTIAAARFTGTDPVYPITQGYGVATAAGTSHVTGTHVPDVDNNMVLAFFACHNASTSFTESSGTERYDVTAGSQPSIAMCSQTQASAASLSVTATSSSSAQGAAFMVVLCGAGFIRRVR